MCPITFLFSTAKCLYSVRNIYGFPICLLLCEIYICPQYLSIIILPFCRKSKHLKGPPIGASSLSSCEPFDVHIYISMYIYVNLPRYIYFTVHIIFVLTPIKPSIRISQWVHDFKPILDDNGSRCKYNCQDLTN